MEKILFRRIGIIFAVLTLLLFGLVSIFVFERQSKAAIIDLNQMLTQAEETYENSKLSMQELTDGFRDDYIHRAKAVDFILAHDYENDHSTEQLQKIRDFMEVTEIYLIDADGIVQGSSDARSIGLNLNDYTQEEAAVILGLLQSQNSDAVAIDMHANSLVKNDAMIYIGIKASSEQYEIVQIAVEQQMLADMLKPSTIQFIIAQTPSIRSKALFIVDRTTGVVESITVNNEQEVNIKDAQTAEKFVEVLDDCDEGRIVEINDKPRYVKSRNMGDKILVAYVDADKVHMDAGVQLFYSFCVICVVMVLVMLVLRYHIQEYVLKDLKIIEDNVEQLVSNNYDVEFKTEHNTEFRNISNLLNSWRDVYRHKSERMSRIIESVNENVAVFECLYSVQQNFFSSNMQSILGTDDETWNAINKTPKSFNFYIQSLLATEKIDDCVYVNGQYLQISAFSSDDAYYGMVMNRTEEALRNQKMQEEAETDPLTGLINRNGFEKRVQQHLIEQPKQGILLIFDLDHFKSVNDAKGHPEGDKVLQIFANMLQSCFRKSDVVGRIGGDEFVVFMDTSVSVQTIESKMEHFLADIRNQLKEYHEQYGLSASIGIAYVDSTIADYQDLYECADVALYIAKDKGKNSFYINKQNIRCMGDDSTIC